MNANLLGKQVTTKTIGNIPIGRLVAIMERKYFEETGTTPLYFNGYEYENVGLIKFSKQQREISFEEFCSYYPATNQHIYDYCIAKGYSEQQIYETCCIFKTEAYYPLEEIVPLEDE